jgi:hypothetical protein
MFLPALSELVLTVAEWFANLSSAIQPPPATEGKKTLTFVPESAEI